MTRMRWFVYSRNRRRRAVERFLLTVHTACWTCVTALVMCTRVAVHWDDWQLMPFGVALASFTIVGSIVVELSTSTSSTSSSTLAPTTTTAPTTATTAPTMSATATATAAAAATTTVATTTATTSLAASAAPTSLSSRVLSSFAARTSCWLLVYSVFANAAGTSFFYRVLTARYGFRSTLMTPGTDDVPLFLCFMTVSYMATYFVVVRVGVRTVCRVAARRRWSPLAVAACCAALLLAIAAGESATNANPFMRQLYCFDRPWLALSFGTVAYASWLAIAAPFWIRLSERASVARVLVEPLVAAALLWFDALALQTFVAPLVVDVRPPGWSGLRAYGADSCLGAAPP